MAASLLGGKGGGGGGLGGALGGLLGGGGTEVTQNVSQSSNSSLGLSFTNLVGAGQVDTNGVSLPVTQSPTATTTSTAAASPDPVYGQTYGPNYTAGDYSSDLDVAEMSGGVINPLYMWGAAAVGVFFVFKSMQGE